METKCCDCGRLGHVSQKNSEKALMGVAFHCPTCNRDTPHWLRGEGADNKKPGIDLVEHCDLATGGEGVLIPDGCEDCVIATYHDDERDCFRAVISLARLQAHFEEEFKDEEDPQLAASEWIGFNVTCAYVGPNTPLYVDEVERA